MDYNFSPSDRLSVTLGWNKLTQTNPFAGGVTAPFPIEYIYKYEFFNVSYTKNFSTNLLNEFRVTAQRSNTLQDKPLKNLPGPAALGFGTIPDQTTGPPYMAFYAVSTI